MENFVKFPRTHHLFALMGSMSRDDLLVDEPAPFYEEEVIIEEKIDGSNLGLDIDPTTGQITAQNRSHFVTSETQSQFKTLQSWIDSNFQALDDILEGGKYILFGEWMYAQHSIWYDKLPDTFIAFDIYDKQNQKFLSVDKRNEKLKDTGISVIREIARGKFKSSKDYERVLHQPTTYCSSANTETHKIQLGKNLIDLKKQSGGKSAKNNKEEENVDEVIVYKGQPIEGIYLRIDDGDFLKKRAKIVRQEFADGIEEHWASKNLVKNVVDYSLKYS